MDVKKMKLEDIAKVCHEVNKAYCISIGDKSQPQWTNCPEWQVESAIKGVQNIINNPDLTPADSHMSWYKQKEIDGWIYGKEKDIKKKTHPCMVAYDLLPAKQRAKDSIFIAVVKGLI